MKIMLPVRWAIAPLVAVPILVGCGSSRPAPISSSFVPAGYSRIVPGTVSNPTASVMAQGDPNVPASVKAHIIRGLPGGPPPPAVASQP